MVRQQGVQQGVQFRRWQSARFFGMFGLTRQIGFSLYEDSTSIGQVKPIRMIALPRPGVVKLNVPESAEAISEASSVAGFAIGGLKLIELGVPLRAEPPLRGFTVQVSAWAVIKRGLKIDPNLSARVSLVLQRLRRFRQA